MVFIYIDRDRENVTYSLRIHQIIKDNVLERNQTRKIEEIKDVLLNKENSSGNNLINITEL